MNTKTERILNASLMIGALGYFIFPFDVLSDVMGPLGYADDGVALTFAFERAQALFSGTSIGKALEMTQKIMGKDFDGEKIAKLLKKR